MAWKSLLFLSILLLIPDTNSQNRIVCFYESWSVYRTEPAKYEPGAIDPFLCTHIIYAFARFSDNNTIISIDEYADIDLGGFSSFASLKRQNKDLKTLLSIGGWDEGSSRFSPLVASRERRQQLTKNIVLFLNEYKFDGLDLHWKYPTRREGGMPDDKRNYAQFIRELREEFDQASLDSGQPSVSVPGAVEYVHRSFDIAKINEYVDWYNILSFDYYDVNSSPANHHAPLYGEFGDVLKANHTINFYRLAGADESKMVLGIPTYGRSYKLLSDENPHFGAPAEGPGDAGPFTDTKGYLTYFEICEKVKCNNWTVVQSNTNFTGPYAYRGNQWVGYDDEAMVGRKARYVADNHLGGVVMWSLNSDDFYGNCSGQRHPLINAAKKALEDRLSLIQNYQKTKLKKIETSANTFTLYCFYCKSKYPFNSNPALCCVRSNKLKDIE